MPSPRANPLISDRDVDFLLHEVLDATALCRLPAFREHSRETFDLFLSSTRRLAREALYPAYRPMDERPARLENGAISVHPLMRELYPQLCELGVIAATRPPEVGGQSLPITVFSLAQAYLGAANPSALGYVSLPTGAAHLLEEYGSEWLKQTFMAPMYRGEWGGTMALSEPHAGSSLADVTTRAVPVAAPAAAAAAPGTEGIHKIRGAKIFISGGDHDLVGNIVHMVLARIEGAPPGIKGVSLFAVPKRRPDAAGQLVDNDVRVAGVVHKIGWRGLASLVMSFGDDDDCLGWLVGAPNRGIAQMFQMMNEARIMVGISAAASALVAYHESVAYALARPQGRPLGSRDPQAPQVPILSHPDVRRMLLRQKAIAEGALSLCTTAAYYQDLISHTEDPAERQRAQVLLDLLTPVVKSFSAEWGFESNTLAVQVHGGYGYSSEYLPESWLRDQKLNSIHEGTTGIHSLDLLGRKVVAGGGQAWQALAETVEAAVARASRAGVEPAWGQTLSSVTGKIGALTLELAGVGLAGDVEKMLRHSVHYLQLFSITVVAWQWLLHAAAAREGLARDPDAASAAFYQGKLCAAQYWFLTELPRVEPLIELCRSAEDSYARMQPDWF